MKNVADGGTRWLDISAERFPGWVSSFARRHGAGLLGVRRAGEAVAFIAGDGALAECYPPFGESFAFPPQEAGFAAGESGGTPSPQTDMDAGGPGGPGLPGGQAVAASIAAHARSPRAVGVFLVRLGGYAAGVFTGYPPVLADAKVGSRLVHGRSAAGGWSQHRFARRREKQANEALDAAADTAVMVFGRWESGITASSAPAREGARRVTGGGGVTRTRSEGGERGAGAAAGRGRRLDAVVLGGDRRAMAELRSDPRLAPYLVLATERFLTVPDPKRAVLERTPKLFTAVRIRITEPPSGGTGGRPPGR